MGISDILASIAGTAGGSRNEYRCPYCGKVLETDDGEYYRCSGEWCMNESFVVENGKLVDLSARRTSSGAERTCANCGQTSTGWEYTHKWENGNEDAYYTCPKCHAPYFIYDD